MYKNSAFRKNSIRKKKTNFERTLFDQSTSSLSYLQLIKSDLIKQIDVRSWYICNYLNKSSKFSKTKNHFIEEVYYNIDNNKSVFN
jgi:hypothetical protein